MADIKRIRSANKNFRTFFQAQYRDARVLLREFRTPLLLFTLLICLGALFLQRFYISPSTGEGIALDEAFYAVFTLIFFEHVLEFPNAWYMQLGFYLIPVLGLVLVGEGVLRFSTALVDKNARGQKWQVAMASTYRNHIIICGLGKVGYRTLLELKQLEQDIIVIDPDENGRFIEKAKLLKVPVIIGDARRSENLIKAGVEHAKTVMPLTNDELANLDIALDAREIKPDIHVVMRLFDPDMARRVRKGFGIHTVFSSSALTAPIFAAAAIQTGIKHSFYVGDDLMNLCELSITEDSEFLDWSVGDFENHMNISVVYLQGQQAANTHPRTEQRLASGDIVLVLAPFNVLEKLRQFQK